MGTKLNVKKADAWINQGAPEEALSFLGEQVETLSKQAIKEEKIFKESERTNMAEDKVKEVVPEVTPEEVPAEITKEDVTKTVPAVTPSVNDSDKNPTTPTTTPNTTDTTPGGDGATLMKMIEAGIRDAVVAGIKQYHTEFGAPLEAKVAELTAAPQTTQKSFRYFENVFNGASDFMPAIAVAEAMKKEFGINTETPVGEISKTTAEVEASATTITKKQVTPSQDPNNLLSGFE